MQKIFLSNHKLASLNYGSKNQFPKILFHSLGIGSHRRMGSRRIQKSITEVLFSILSISSHEWIELLSYKTNVKARKHESNHQIINSPKSYLTIPIGSNRRIQNILKQSNSTFILPSSHNLNTHPKLTRSKQHHKHNDQENPSNPTIHNASLCFCYFRLSNGTE